MDNHQCQNTAQEQPILIKGPYYQKRVQVYEWAKNQCLRWQLNRQTYANSMCLMDRYFKTNKLQKSKFVEIALCLIIISTKSFETKVLFTKSVAKRNILNQEQMCKLQLSLIQFFEYRVSSYNFVRVMNQYIRRWDLLLSSKGVQNNSILFLKDSVESYLLYEEIYYLCQSQLKYKNFLLQQTLRHIIKFVIRHRCSHNFYQQATHDIDNIFTKKMLLNQQENVYVYEIAGDDAQLDGMLEMWRGQFLKVLPSLRKRYQTERKNFKTYGQFLSRLT